MDARKLKTLFLLVILSIAVSVQAQDALPLIEPVSGSISPNATQQWTFNAQSGAVMSFALRAETPDFDPMITLTDSSGREVVSSDDYNYPESLNPLLEAITMPRTDSYTLTVSGVNGSAGDYSLTLLQGNSVLAYTDDFSETTWQPQGEATTVSQNDEQLQMTVVGGRQMGVAFDDNAETYADFYAQVQVVVNNPAGWLVGIPFRRAGDDYYLLSINNSGNWRFSLVSAGTESVIRDWTPHPNIVPGATNFSLGVLAKDVGFDFFYNTGYIGSSSDSTLTAPGQIGLMLGTNASQGSESSAAFTNLVVTQPTLINGAGVIPEQVLAGDGRAMVQALKRHHVVSADGEMMLTLGESSVEYARPGINRVMLGRGVRYTHFALGTTVQLNAAAPGPAGCGLVFRFTSETDYTLAYLNQNGEYGVSLRHGDTFEPGLYGQNSAIRAGEHHLLVIADEETVYYYVDRKLVGSQPNTPENGEVGIAVVNFEPNSTACTFSNFWLWQWD